MSAHGLLSGWRLTMLMSVIVFVINLPIILIALNSLQSTTDIIGGQSLLPRAASLNNYIHLLKETPFLVYLQNSLVTAAGATILSMSCGVTAAYAMSRFRSRVVDFYGVALFAVQMFPLILAIIPLFLAFRVLGLIDNPLSVIIVCAVMNLPFVTFMARTYFDAIPLELQDAALIDGCGHFGTLIRVVLPLSRSGLAAVSIFAFLLAYNEYFVANVFLRTQAAMTLPVGIQMFLQQFSTDWGSLTAAATLTMAPTIVLFFFVQKLMTQGVLAGGVKG